MNIFRQLLVAAVLLLPIFPALPVSAQDETPVSTDTPSASIPGSEAQAQLLQTRQQLEEIQKTIQEKRSLIEQQRKQLEREKDESERRELEWRIEREETDITNLRRSFENIALGGVDLSAFDPAQEDQQFNWQQELQLILKPVFQELKDLTEKPRQIERLRARLAILENQQRIAKRALTNLERLLDESLDKDTKLRLENVRQTWVQRQNDIQRQLEINQLQLDVLLDEEDTIFTQIQNAINEFFTGRGLNLALSIAAFFLMLFLMKGLYLLIYPVQTQGWWQQIHHHRQTHAGIQLSGVDHFSLTAGGITGPVYIG